MNFFHWIISMALPASRCSLVHNHFQLGYLILISRYVVNVWYGCFCCLQWSSRHVLVTSGVMTTNVFVELSALDNPAAGQKYVGKDTIYSFDSRCNNNASAHASNYWYPPLFCCDGNVTLSCYHMLSTVPQISSSVRLSFHVEAGLVLALIFLLIARCCSFQSTPGCWNTAYFRREVRRGLNLQGQAWRSVAG